MGLGEAINFKNDQNEIINVLIINSEGLGSNDEDINHDLGLVLRLCEHLKNAKFNDFSDFYWILEIFL